MLIKKRDFVKLIKIHDDVISFTLFNRLTIVYVIVGNFLFDLE